MLTQQKKSAKEPPGRLSMMLYQDSVPVTEFKAIHLGFMGISFAGSSLSYPKFTQLEVAVIDPQQPNLNGFKFPVVVTKSSRDEMGLTLTDYGVETVKRWLRVLTANSVQGACKTDFAEQG